MSTQSIAQSFPIFTNIDGQPLESGNIYIGTAGLNPVSNPITVYWDAALTAPASQPIRTTGGYPMNSGSPGMLYTGEDDYSLRVSDKNDSTVYSSLNVTGRGGAFKSSSTGAVVRSASSKMNDMVSVLDFGAKGDGVTDDAGALDLAIASGAKGLIFPSGNYLINSSKTFTKPVIILDGAVLKPRSSAVLTFNNGIESSGIQIFDTTDDFTSTSNAYVSNTSVKILGCKVKADWFCLKVSSADDIKTIPDQTNNMTKAWRAAIGDYVADGSDFINEYSNGVLELGAGYYRIDSVLRNAVVISGTFYRLNGGRITGQGVSSSFLIRTNLTSLDFVIYSIYTAEITTYDNFKINCYDPDAGSPYNGQSEALMFLQGDSVQVRNVWVSGAQVSSGNDANGYARSGVGIQFNSAIDSFLTDVFIEFCITGLGIASSTVFTSNVEIYNSQKYGIGIGNFVSTFPDSQTTTSRLTMTNTNGQAMKEVGIQVIESGGSTLLMNGAQFNGFNSEVSLTFGTNFLALRSGCSIVGSIQNALITSFNSRLIYGEGINCSLGTAEKAFCLSNVIYEEQSAQATGSVSYGVFHVNESGVYLNLYVTSLTLKNVRAGLFIISTGTGQASFKNVSLSGYVGEVDNSANRQLGTGTGNIRLENFNRDNSDVTALNQFAFWSSGEIYVDIRNLYNSTRTIGGAATELMPSTTTFA